MNKRNDVKKVLKSAIAFMVALVMCFSMTNVNVYAEEIVATEVEDVADSPSNWDGVTTENNYVGDNYSVTFTLTDYWAGGYNANIKLENTGDTLIYLE